MRSMTPMKIAKFGYITVSVLWCALGIVLIAMPSISASVLGITLGVMTIIFGIVKLIGYFSRDLFRLAFQYDLATGFLLLVLGTVLLIYPEHVIAFFCTVFGILVLADGLFKIQITFDAKRFGIRKWWMILSVAVLAIVFGGIVIFSSLGNWSVMSVMLGLALLFEGLLNICTVITAVKIIRNQKPDIIEVDCSERKD